jgi:uncharacterized protein YqfA (UPF0365 family)
MRFGKRTACVGLAIAVVVALSLAAALRVRLSSRVITQADLERVKIGTSEEEIIALFGPPVSSTPGSDKVHATKLWRGDNYWLLANFFDDGTVATYSGSCNPPAAWLDPLGYLIKSVFDK